MDLQATVPQVSSANAMLTCRLRHRGGPDGTGTTGSAGVISALKGGDKVLKMAALRGALSPRRWPSATKQGNKPGKNFARSGIAAHAEEPRDLGRPSPRSQIPTGSAGLPEEKSCALLSALGMFDSTFFSNPNRYEHATPESSPMPLVLLIRGIIIAEAEDI